MPRVDKDNLTAFMQDDETWTESEPAEPMLPDAPVEYSLDEPLKVKEEEMLGNAKYARNILQSLAMKSQQLVELSLNRLADEETVSSRGIEVTSNAIAQTADLAERLLDLDAKIMELQGSKPQPGPQTVNYTQNNITCTTAELLKKLKNLEEFEKTSGQPVDNTENA